MKDFTNEQNKVIGKAIEAEYATGYRNGWQMCHEQVLWILDKFENKVSWTWEELYAAIEKANEEQFK